MHQMPVDKQKTGAIISLMSQMITPDFVIKCARSHKTVLLNKTNMPII
jgi:hypothetical protein